MDSVPFAFCKRVAAMWNCCEHQINCPCDKVVLEDVKWTFSKEQQCTYLVFGYLRQTWMYGIRNPLNLEQFLAIDQRKKITNLKKVRIVNIAICSLETDRDMNRLDSDSLDFLSSLCNEPDLHLSVKEWNIFDTPVGSTLLLWFQTRWFGRVYVNCYHPICDRLIEKQFSRRIPRMIAVFSVIAGDDFLKESLHSGLLRLFHCRKMLLSHELLTIFIENFLANPQDYTKDNFRIWASFEPSPKAKLEDMTRRGLCRSQRGSYVFGRQSPHLHVCHVESNQWKICVIE